MLNTTPYLAEQATRVPFLDLVARPLCGIQGPLALALRLAEATCAKRELSESTVSLGELHGIAGAFGDGQCLLNVRLHLGHTRALQPGQARVRQQGLHARGGVRAIGEYYELRAGSRLVSAQVLLQAGRIEEARGRAEEVLDLARPRGDVVFEGRARDLIERAALPS